MVVVLSGGSVVLNCVFLSRFVLNLWFLMVVLSGGSVVLNCLFLSRFVLNWWFLVVVLWCLIVCSYLDWCLIGGLGKK